MLPKEDASYAGMAKAYRDYLMKSRQLKLPDQPARPLVDLYMGALPLRLPGRLHPHDHLPLCGHRPAAAGQGGEGLRRAAHRLERRRGAGLLAPALPGRERAGGQRRPARLHRLRAQERGQGLPGRQLPLRLHHLLGGIFGQIPIVRNIWPAWSYGFNTRFDTMRGVNKLPVFQGAGRATTTSASTSSTPSSPPTTTSTGTSPRTRRWG